MSEDVMRTIAYELSNGAGETITIREERHQIESYSHIYPTDIIHPLVRQSDALAKLAERDAEIAKLREYYAANEDINRVGLLGATPEMFARERKARAALKDRRA